MLTHLQIRDFAIIDAVELELRTGLTVLTGETGAGKSIVVDALQLLAGGRAGAEAVRHDAERAEVSGTFDITQAPRELKQWLEEQSVGAGRFAPAISDVTFDLREFQKDIDGYNAALEGMINGR